MPLHREAIDFMNEQELNNLTREIIRIAIDVHRELGPGLLEKAYQTCLQIALEEEGYQVKSEFPLPIHFRGRKVMDEAYRIDLLVNNTVVIEVKSVNDLAPIHSKQLFTYLKHSNKLCGLLMNFNTFKLTDGVRRVRNGYLTDGKGQDNNDNKAF